MTNTCNVVVVGVPLVDTLHAPLAAPAVLKSSLTKAGIDSIAIDLNIEVLLKIKSHPERENLMKFFQEQHVEDHVVQEISKILFYCAHRILDQNPTIIALSLLTYECQNFTLWLCAVLKNLRPQCKIVIGGPGIKYFVSNFDDTTFRDTAKQLNLIDDWIAGDGDQSLIEYVNGNYDYPGINNDNWLPVKDFDDLPYPDWSDYNFYLYSQTFIPIIDAKGCVRSCEFCDVIEYWKKFQFRNADKIFEEMLHQIGKYNMRNFDFRSSITNGNLKEFKKLLDLMYEYNQKKKYKPEQISWNASFIVRQQSQHTEEMFKKMGATYATLSLGIESLIPHVRQDLGKHFDNSDIDYHLEMASKYNVQLNLLLITGYPTETLEDYDFTKQWFRDRVQYKNCISRLFLSPAAILTGTRLHKNIDKYKIIPIGENLTQLTNWQTQSISKKQREDYHYELISLCRNELGYNIDAY
jgi:radical SAM superfamily enzyme YgiQ (UPF0313 family)